MSNKQNSPSPFLENPYPYKSVDDGRILEDSIFLQKLFGKTENEVKDASASYIGNSDGLRNFIFTTRNYEHLRRVELSDNATSLAVAIIIFAIEAIMTHVTKVPLPKRFKGRKKPKPKMSVKEYRLIQYLRLCLTREEKLLLLNSLVFSAIASKTVPMRSGTVRHVMYRGMLKEWVSDKFEHFETDWCSAQESIENIHCYCIRWLTGKDEKKVNYYIRQLSGHLYRMRCSIVHEGIAPIISHTEEKPPNVDVWGMTVSDVYFDNKRYKHFQYNSALSRKRLEEIFTTSLWSAFEKGYPRKINSFPTTP